MIHAIRVLIGAASLAGIIVLWSWLASKSDPVTLPSPMATCLALIGLLSEASFWVDTLLPSLLRIVSSVLIAFAAGVILGTAAGLIPLLRPALFPIRLVLSGMPAAVFVVLLLVWTGPTSATTIIAASVMLVPLFYVATLDGLDSVDSRLSEMAFFYQVPWQRRFRAIAFPAMAVALLPAIRTGAANGVRVTVLAEILAGTGGLGDSVNAARQYLETDKLFALILIVIALVLATEWLLALLVGGSGTNRK